MEHKTPKQDSHESKEVLQPVQNEQALITSEGTQTPLSPESTVNQEQTAVTETVANSSDKKQVTALVSPAVMTTEPEQENLTPEAVNRALDASDVLKTIRSSYSAPVRVMEFREKLMSDSGINMKRVGILRELGLYAFVLVLKDEAGENVEKLFITEATRGEVKSQLLTQFLSSSNPSITYDLLCLVSRGHDVTDYSIIKLEI